MYLEALNAGGCAVVTGGANGVGLAAATRFAQSGLNVILADLPGDTLDAAVDTVRAASSGTVDVFGLSLIHI